MKRKKLIEQLKKLRTLSERGATEHERDTAQRMFDTICQTHGIALHEIVDVREVRFFEVKSKYDRRLLVQIVAVCLDTKDFSLWKKGRKRNQLGVELTEAEYVQVGRLYHAYRAAFEKEIERTYRAFIQANDVYPKSTKMDKSELTAEELEELCQIMAMSTVIPKTCVHAEITG